MTSQNGAAEPMPSAEAPVPALPEAPTLERPKFRLADIMALIRREQWLIAGFSVAGPLAALAVTALTPPVYQGDLLLKIDNERPQIVEGQRLVDPIVQMSDVGRYLATLIKLTTSRSLATTVMDSLALAKDDRFIVAMGKSAPDASLAPAQREAIRREMVIKLLTDNISMVAPGDSHMAELTFNSCNPALAAQIANEYGQRFVSQNVQQQADANAYASKILHQQVEETRVQLSEAENKAIRYARENNLIDASDAAASSDGNAGSSNGGEKSITTASLVAMNNTYNAARAARIAIEQRWRTAAAATGTDFPEASANGAVQGLIQQRASAEARLVQLRTHYIETQPDVVEQAAQIRVLDDQIAKTIRSIKASLRAEYGTALSQEQALVAQSAELASQTLEEQQKRVQLNLLARDADTLRLQLRDLMTRLNQVNSASDVTANNMVIVDRAEVPQLPISPNLFKNLLLGIIAGIGLGLVVAVLRQLLDDTLHTPEDVEGKLNIPLLGVTPWVGDAIERELKRPLSGLREAYHSIRTSVDFASGGARNKVLLVTSSASDEGKSTASLAIAQDFVRIGRRVLLVDADMRRPSLYHHFGIDSAHPGLTDIIAGSAEFADALCIDEDLGLNFLPMGSVPNNPSPLLSSDALTTFITDRRKEYDIILIDSPPVIGLADTPLLSRMSDGVIFVVEASRAHHGQVKSAIRRMRNHGAKVLGAIVSKYDAQTSGYGYHYGYGYGYGYGYNYGYGYGQNDRKDGAKEG